MIHAISQGKADPKNFRQSEDSLTSLIWERLSYLPVETLESLLNRALWTKSMPIKLGRFLNFEFWPHWSPSETNNSTFVEPDVFVRGDEFDLIIEAKRWNQNQQYAAQWQAEIQAYRNEYQDEERKLVFIALGGLTNRDLEKVKVSGTDYWIHKMDWTSLANAVRETRISFEDTRALLSIGQSSQMILDDIALVLETYGFSSRDWFENYTSLKIAGNTSLQSLFDWSEHEHA